MEAGAENAAVPGKPGYLAARPPGSRKMSAFLLPPGAVLRQHVMPAESKLHGVRSNTAMSCREMIGVKRECKASCPMCKTVFPLPLLWPNGVVKVSCPNRECRGRLEVETGFHGLQKAKWIGPPAGLKRATI